MPRAYRISRGVFASPISHINKPSTNGKMSTTRPDAHSRSKQKQKSNNRWIHCKLPLRISVCCTAGGTTIPHSQHFPVCRLTKHKRLYKQSNGLQIFMKSSPFDFARLLPNCYLLSVFESVSGRDLLSRPWKRTNEARACILKACF